MNKPYYQLRACAFTLALLITSSGCSRTPLWFIGQYEFDGEALAKQHIQILKNRQALPEAERPSVGLADINEALLAPVAVMQLFQGATLTISTDEIVITRNGAATVVRFLVQQEPKANALIIRTSDNRIETWKKTESGIALQGIAGAPTLKVPFKRMGS